MKKLRIAIVLLCFFQAGGVFGQEFEALKKISIDMLEELEGEKYEAIYARFDSTMKAAMKPAQIAQLMPSLRLQMGSYNTYGEQTTGGAGGYAIVLTRMKFENGDLLMRLAFNADKEISGLFFQPAPQKQEAQTTTDFSEENFVIENGDFELPGFLTLPGNFDNKYIVVLVHGSGANDRNETIGPNTPFKDLAYGLAKRGIASLRYDKRTYVYGAASAPDPKKLSLQEETIDDALQAVKQLKALPRFANSKVILVGHSLGAFAGPAMAKQSAQVDGLIMMAGNARPLEELLEYQYNYLSPEETLSPAEKEKLRELKLQLKEVEKMRRGESYDKENLPLGTKEAYWQYLVKYDPVKTLKGLTLPVLVLQGERDYQVTMTDFEIFKKAMQGKSNIQFISYPKLNHLFLEGEGESRPEEYQTPASIPDYVYQDIADWIRKH